MVKPGILNARIDQLSKITNGEEYSSLEDNFLYAQFFSVQIVDEYFVDIIEFLSTGFAPREFTTMKKKYLVVRYVDY